MTFRAIDPTTGVEIADYAETTDAELEMLLARAAEGAAVWRRTPLDERTARLRAIAKHLRAAAAGYAALMAKEMGKPIVEGEGEIEKCAVTCEWFADESATMLAVEERQTDARRAYLRFDPLGAVLAVMPWNFPFWQFFRAAVPALAAGNTIVLKHAQNVPGCAEAIQSLADAAGFPPGVVTNVRIASERVAGLIADHRIHAVTLTGSTRAGAAVATAAGRVLKKTVLELGGSDAYLVLEDADLDAAARVAADARLVNGGQSCIAAKRFIVVSPIADAFVERFVAAMRSRKVGNPLERTTQVGPLARHVFRDEVHRQTTASIARGARCVLGGTVPDGPGAFYPPTVLVEAAPGMAVFDEETFGPVAAVVRARDEADAIRLANASRFGLGAAVWTRDDVRAGRVAAALEAGAICINGQVRSDPRLPFGGVKESGYGRELSEYGIREFVNVKAVVVR